MNDNQEDDSQQDNEVAAAIYHGGTPSNALRSARRVAVAKGVTIIAERAFQDCESVESLRLVRSIETIDHSAFERCQNLKEIWIPRRHSGLLAIEGMAFAECSNIKELLFPRDAVLERIGPAGFAGCLALLKVEIPASCEYIQFGCFHGCQKLSTVSFLTGPEGELPRLEGISRDAFRRCVSLTSIDLQSATQFRTIGNSAFRDCHELRSVRLPSSIQCIERRALQDCTSLCYLEFPASLNHLERVTQDVLSGCTALQHIKIPAANPALQFYFDTTSRSQRWNSGPCHHASWWRVNSWAAIRCRN